MTTIPIHFQLDWQPTADPDAVILSGQARFTLLTARLIRLEYAANGRFTDQPSQTFWYRRQPVPDFTTAEQDGTLTITTDHLQLTYTGGPFTAESLQIDLINRQSSTVNVAKRDRSANCQWKYGAPDTENLLGTARTLDMVSGATQLEPGLLSRQGWTLVDDSQALLFNEAGWIEPRRNEGIDLYFFGYGHAYTACLRDYQRVAGPTPMLPRWALGNWWSRYWAYSQAELTALMRQFQANGVPLSVCIVDMDWHITDIAYEEGEYAWHSWGWTGYTWNQALFPDPPGFIRWLHQQGLKTALNLHPADGVWPHEAGYAAMARRMGIDPASQQPIKFAIADPHFAIAYLEELHHPLEADGVDFWWMDWQQGTDSGLAGLDPLWWLNHVHFHDLGRARVKGDPAAAKRPFIFSRWGGLGNHRYPIGFSGDTHVTWESLAFQPYFTANAANVAYGWWSHDIGGHMMGVEEPELYARWVQFGLFSPILRLHSTKNEFHERRPWGYDAAIFRVAQRAMQLRHAFIPYLYTLSWRNATTGEAPVRPMFHDYPDQEAAYHCPGQYSFGPDLIAAPYTSPADPDTRLSRQVVWLPPGAWRHFFTGEYYEGDRWLAVYGGLDDIPVFARAGAIVPLGPRLGWGGVDNPVQLHLHCFAGADGEFTLFEDDGESLAYRQGEYGLTRLAQTWGETEWQLTIAGEKPHHTIPEAREFQLHLHGVVEPKSVGLTMDGKFAAVPGFTHDPQTETAHIAPIRLAAGKTAVLSLRHSSGLASRRDRTEEKVRRMLTAFKLDTMAKSGINGRWDELRQSPDMLADYAFHLTDTQAQALLEVVYEIGVHYVRDTRQPHLLLLWNNRERPMFRYQFTRWRDIGDLRQRFQGERKVVPRFKVLTPEENWQLGADYLGLVKKVIRDE